MREHPDYAFLAVEVCYSSDYNDRVIKTRLYVTAGIPEYWIVDVEQRCIEIYTEPRGKQYAAKRIVSEGMLTPIEIPRARVDVAALFA